MIIHYDRISQGFLLDVYLLTLTKDPITRTQAYRIIKDLAKEAEIDYMVGTHSLRKSYGRWLYDSGMNLADIAKMMQHNSTDYTLRYICIDSEQMKENREGLHFDPKFKP